MILFKKNKKQEEVEINPALQASIAPVGIEFFHNQLILGENFCRIYAIVEFPAEVNYGWLSKITNIPSAIVTIGYVPINNNEFTNNLSSQINRDRGEELGAKNPLQRLKKAKAADDGEKILEQVVMNNESIGEFSILIMVLSRDADDFYDKCSRTENIVNALGCKIRIVSHLQKEAYQHLSPTFPLNSKVSDIANRPFPISTFVGGFPFSSSGFCDPTGFYLGKNSDGGIIIFDPWLREKSRTNSNITITGDTGMGKSTILKHIIHSEYARGTKIIVIDPEAEYREICRSDYIKGNWIDTAGGRGGIINPLQIRPAPRDDDDKSEEENDINSGIGDLAIHIKTLEVFFKLYLPDLTDKHRAILNQELIKTYETFGISWETDVTKLRNTEFPIMSDLQKQIVETRKTATKHKELYDDLELYLDNISNGADRGIWNKPTTIDGNSNFICLDTKSIADMGENIKSAQYFNVLTWCWEQISHDRTERVMLVADECWMLIDPKCPQSLNFLRTAEKRARKYEGSIVVSTQSIVDFLDPTVKQCGQAVLDMPAIKIILGADLKSLQDTKDLFNLNEAQHDLIASRQRGVALMKSGSQVVKVKFVFSDERLKMFGKGGGR